VLALPGVSADPAADQPLGTEVLVDVAEYDLLVVVTQISIFTLTPFLVSSAMR
jgi:hypothetical protein